ncbi:hypothetical protein LEP1GSC021_1213 [Leptospira noguchii str. 1993005606]|nr:hypothetical protein LEP1GSC021_1213 [Leptospira noguchii str. 1993005606]
MGKFERFFSIRKTYFLQVKNLILVGTLEKCAFWIAFEIESKDNCCIIGRYGIFQQECPD